MATNDDKRPVSAGNVRAALAGVPVFKTIYEYTGTPGYSSVAYCNVVCSEHADNFDYIIITWQGFSSSGQSTGVNCAVVDMPSKPYLPACSIGRDWPQQVRFDYMDENVALYRENSFGFPYILRVVGVNLTGGGQLLTELSNLLHLLESGVE